MRVIGGEARGHRLRAPSGQETRPTSDKVREAVFDVLGAEVDGQRVLDLFAGTGALGIEALSRGADDAVFIEKRPQACRAIRENLAHTRLDVRARLMCAPVERALDGLDGPFGLLFLDPPYAYADIHGIMARVGRASFTARDAIVVFEHSPRVTMSPEYARLALRREKVYGDTAVSFYVAREDDSL